MCTVLLPEGVNPIEFNKDIIYKMDTELHVKCRLCLSDFIWTWIFSKLFRILLTHPVMKIRIFPCGQTDRQTDRHNEFNCGISSIAKVPKIYLLLGREPRPCKQQRWSQRGY